MDSLTQSLQAGRELTLDEVETAVAGLLDAGVADAQKAALLRALRAKGETADELAGFAQALLKRAVPLALDPARLPGPAIDVCGTGGDRQGFFNVSTTTMFAAAACGMTVVKHGNRSVTSQTGAADVLEELGVPIDSDATAARAALEEHGVSFIFAPLFHPAIKAVGPVRKALAAEGTATIFNMLGPLLNPARPDYQLVGIFSAGLLEKYAEALREIGRKRAWAVHGQGTDELTLTGPSEVHAVENGELRAFSVDPNALGLRLCEPDCLRGGDRVENARILIAILDGTETGPKREIVLLNTAAACVISGISASLEAGLEKARAAINSGAALAKLNALRRFQK
jgi:anthranilate phosphoribosyltransferase